MHERKMSLSKSIPLCLPKLPQANQIIPYLEQIDANRWYSNYGPLTREFLARAAALFRINTSEIICASSGTALLELCLRALQIEEGSICLTPSWTFIATPSAIVSAKLKPVFIDVDVKTQAVDPKKLAQDIPELTKMGKIGAVIVVAPFGMPVDVKAWDSFTEDTGIHVIIDAAAGFDSVLQSAQMSISKTPTMISLHATKVLGAGEGGILLSTNEKLIDRVESLTQFGFPKGVRNAQCYGTNAKISEYTAAVGLAALDCWENTRAAWDKISKCYQAVLNEAGIAHLLCSDWITSTCNVLLPMQADNMVSKLNALNIQARKWWGDGCHHQTAFRNTEAMDLSNTEYLRQSVFGLPFYIGMGLEEIEMVVEHVIAG